MQMFTDSKGVCGVCVAEGTALFMVVFGPEPSALEALTDQFG